MHRFAAPIARAIPSLRSSTTRLPISTLKNSPSQLSTRSLTTSAAKMSQAPATSNAILDLVKTRRTYYSLNKEVPISTDRVQDIVKEALWHVPSSFNSQSNRVIVLFGADHEKFWDITTEVLKSIVPADKWAPTSAKMAGFKAGAGTVLFFEDQDVVKAFQEKFPSYHPKFPIWATQSDAMLQYTIWTALEHEGLGANLQHYDPVVDEKVAAEWKVPANWKLNAQLVFGGRAAEPGQRTYQDLEDRYKAYGA